MTARVVVSDNLTWLMKQRPELSTPAAVEIATAKNNAKVGRSSIDRAKNGVANLTIENLEAIAQVFGREAWELLHPGLVKGNLTPTPIHSRTKSLDSALPKLRIEDLQGLGPDEISSLTETVKSRASELRVLAEARALIPELRKANGN